MLVVRSVLRPHLTLYGGEHSLRTYSFLCCGCKIPSIERKRWKYLGRRHSHLLVESQCHNNSSNFLYPQRENITAVNLCKRWLKKPAGNGDKDKQLSHLFVPLKYEHLGQPEDELGEEMVGPLKKEEILSLINRFYTDKEVKELAREQGLDQYLYQQTIISFRKYCIDSNSLPTDLHIVFNDIIKGAGHLHDIYPYFFKHAKSIFPHLDCMDDLYKISDLTQPPNWYPEARAIDRKIIIHVGPTNSGKTYHAMEQFLAADTAVYCGPLKLLATEVYQKSNSRGTPCDLVTGEERKYAVSEEFPASHVACTVEMVSTSTPYDVAVIDEIQLLRDQQRGWAWTRALLGVAAKEVHLCGEGSAVEIIQELGMCIGDDVEVRRYKRLTSLSIEDSALNNMMMVRPGDCIVCFSKAHIHKVVQDLERLGKEVAVIYGGLPPGTKLIQAQKFNDPDHSCKIMVATDAIGMGLNLSIRRIIFYSMIKPFTNEKGEKEMDTITCSEALQIGGRAGRFGTQYEEGYVTTLKPSDLLTLKKLMATVPNVIEQCGLHPTAEQIELFAFHLPSYTLSNLVDIFINLCKVDTSLYFMCMMDDFKFLADLIQHISLQLRMRYVFCCAPISRKAPFACAMFLKFARQCSQSEPITLNWLCRQVKWPLLAPKTVHQLVHLEEVFDVFDLYLWLSYRFPDLFPDGDLVRGLQQELDKVIQVGVGNITQLLKYTTSGQLVEFDKEPRNNQQRGFVSHNESSSSDFPTPDSQVPKSKKRLTERLLRQGLLSPKMLEDLKNEWRSESYSNSNEAFDDRPNNTRPRKGKKF